jgi:hypothetical protein
MKVKAYICHYLFAISFLREKMTFQMFIRLPFIAVADWNDYTSSGYSIVFAKVLFPYDIPNAC